MRRIIIKSSVEKCIRQIVGLSDSQSVSNFVSKGLFLAVGFFYSTFISAYDFEVDGLYYNKLSNNEVEVTYKRQIDLYRENDVSGDIIIPSKIRYSGVEYTITGLGGWAFANDDYLTSIVIPNTVKSIGVACFWECHNLKKVTIPNSVTSMGNSVFCNCERLSELILPDNLTMINNNLMYGCLGLESVNIPQNVTSIGEDSFYGCKKITRITIPSLVTSISRRAFYGCSKLKTVISEIKRPFEIETNVFTGLSDAILQVPKGTKNEYKKYSGWCVNGFKDIVEIENSKTYSLTIIATGNGSASYSGTIIRGKTTTFTVNEGTNATITFTSDNGYRKKTVKVNNIAVSVGNNQYTVSNIRSNTTVEVEFEAIPPTTYSLSIKVTGNGSASYSGTTIRSKTTAFTVNEGTNAKISFTPDNGYRIKTVRVNNADVTSSVSNNSYTINNISKDTNVEVEFEAIPATTYTLSIIASGSGSASYNGTTVRSKTSMFTVNEGTNVSITFTPDNGYRIKSVKENNTTVTSYVSSNTYTISNISRNTTVEVEFEAIPPTTYTLSIKAIGNGSASYNGTAIRSKTTTFTVNEGTNATITFSPDNGYRIKTVKVNNTAVSVSNNQYTVSNIRSYTTVEVEFEEIPAITYSLSIQVIGYGSVSYDGVTVRSNTNTFTVNEGTNATITFTPDYGYQIKSVKENDSDVTVYVHNNAYTIYDISRNTYLEVEFEVIPITTYDLSISASGNGSASYDGTTIRNRTTSFAVNEGTYATINFAPDNGYRIKNVKENYYNVTSQVRNNSYTTYISGNTTIEVEFEAIPPTTYSLSIKATGNGSASYDGTTIRTRTSSFTLNEGSNAMITFTPDNGYRIKSLMVNNADETANISNNTYIISNIVRNTSVEVEFEEEPKAFAVDGVNYAIRSNNEKTVAVSRGTYGVVLEIPEKVTFQKEEWKVTSIENNALSNSPDLSAIIWNPEAAFTENVKNPNLLLYVKSEDYAPTVIKNVVVNGTATSITLTDAASGNNFYCPQEFTAQTISYTHHYTMETGLGESRGWETIALPFEVQKITHQSKGEIVPFANWKSGDSKKPFWLKEFGSRWPDASSIKAYTPYIISMPNHAKYKEEFKLNGYVTFSAENARIGKTENLSTSSYNGRTFVPNFSLLADKTCYALNVNNDYSSSQRDINENEGSIFYIGLRDIHPFEAYMTTASGTRAIAIEDDMTTGIKEIMEMLDEQKDMKVYNLKGQLIKTVEGKTMDEVRKMLPAGVYIVNGQKLIMK